MVIILGLSGIKGSGKDTVADYIISNYEGYVKVSFASILKDIVSLLFDWDRNMLEGDTLKSREFRETQDDWWSMKLNKKWTPRIALQSIGTDIFREHLHVEIWLMVIEKKIRNYISEGKNVLITDIRFLNEFNFVKETLGGKVCLISRSPKCEKSGLEHVSECGIFEFETKVDFVLINNETIDKLKEEIDEMMKFFK